jgi:GNAT superfamily N-acetyltransferase
MHFDRDYVERATLRDGTEVVLRLIRPEDKELLHRGFKQLSDESRYRRFFAVKHDLTPQELRYLTEVDGVRHFALGAVSADGHDGIGVARFIQLDGEPGVAEAAIAVADAHQGKGLGSLLFQRLVAAASERGVARFRCEVLGSNKGMADLVLALSPEVSVQVSAGVSSMEFAVPRLAPEHPAHQPPRDSGLYRFFGMVAQGAIEWTAAWQRMGLRFLGEDVAAPSRSWDGDSIDESE